MSEEIANPSVVVPRSILASMLINGFAGFGMTLAVLFCSGSLEQLLETKFPFPFMIILYNATTSLAATSVMSSVIIILGGCATVGVLASASRVIWSFARDRGIPGWKILSKVSPWTLHANAFPHSAPQR